MTWFMERGNEGCLACELRRADHSDVYEFVVEATTGTVETARFVTPTEMIEGYLRRQSELRAEGWRPRPAPMPMFA